KFERRNKLSSNIYKRFVLPIGSVDPRSRNFYLAQGLSVPGDLSNISERTLWDNIMDKHQDRINRYSIYWDMYLGNHWYTVSEENIDPLKVNFCKETVNKHAWFLSSKGFVVESDFPEIDKFLKKQWSLNDIKKLGIDLAIQGGITGDVFLEVTESVHPEYNETYYKLNDLDSRYSFPVFNKRELKGFLFYGDEEY